MWNKSQGGFTLIEMIIAIVIISVGVAGVLAAFNIGVRGSVEPLIAKQMLAAAEGMMEEILLKPYDIEGTPPAHEPTACGSPAASRSAFDDLRDYDGYQTTGICDVNGALTPGLGDYSVAVRVAETSLEGAPALQITVTVGRGNDSIRLDAFRTNPELL